MEPDQRPEGDVVVRGPTEEVEAAARWPLDVDKGHAHAYEAVCSVRIRPGCTAWTFEVELTHFGLEVGGAKG